MENLWQAFVVHADTSDRSFIDRLRDQLIDSPKEVHRVAVDLVVLYWLFPNDVGREAKLDLVKGVVGLKLSEDPPDYDALGQVFSHGIGAAGPRYRFARHSELAFYIRFCQRVRGGSADPRSAEACKSLADEVKQEVPGSHEARNIILHLLFPDQFERTASEAQKRKIVQAYPKEAGQYQDLDEGLANIRRALVSSLGREDVDFYEPQIRGQWDPLIPPKDVSPAAEKPATADSTPRSWIFQANPNYYEIERAVHKVSEITWLVAQHRDEIKLNDRVYIWQSGANAGVLAIGRVGDQPTVRSTPATETEFIKEQDKFAGNKLRVSVPIVSRLNPPLTRQEILAIPELAKLSILSMAQGSNFPVTAAETQALDELIATRMETLGERPTRLKPALLSMQLDGLKLDPAVIPGILGAIDAGNHVILTGPPGTGKTKLAEQVAQAATALGYTNGYVLTTASSDWTTFDTLGGYMPDPAQPSRLRFERGVVLDAIAQDKWLLLDEINRADADKAFGALLTLLAGFRTELTFRDAHDRRYQLSLTDRAESSFDEAAGSFRVGKNWRILATMNTRDKNALYALSYAFMRRFSFVYVGPPSDATLSAVVQEQVASDEARRLALKVAGACPVPLGPAIVVDIAKLIAEHDDLQMGVRNAVIAYILPQLEGREPKKISVDLAALASAAGASSSTAKAWADAAGVLVGLEVLVASPSMTDEEAVDINE